MMRRICLLGLIVGLMAGVAAGQMRQPATPELLANTETVQPGEAFLVGVRFTLEPTWHVYWKHAGQAGIPTEIKFELPEGFEVGELQYPVPIKFVQPGNILGYGYEDEVMFLAQVTPPADLSAGDVSITARVKWLVCADICIPGDAELVMTLPVADEARPANRELFATWAGRIPTVEGSAGRLISNVETEVQQAGRGATNLTTIDASSPLSEVDFYPGGDPGLRIEDVQVEQVGPQSIRLRYTVSPLAGRKQWPEQLEGLVVYTSEHGRSGTMITFPTPALPDESQP